MACVQKYEELTAAREASQAQVAAQERRIAAQKEHLRTRSLRNGSEQRSPTATVEVGLSSPTPSVHSILSKNAAAEEQDTAGSLLKLLNRGARASQHCCECGRILR